MIVHLEPNEKVFSEIRKHWILIFNEITIAVALSLLPFLILIIILGIAGVGLSGQFFAFYFFMYSLIVLSLWVFIFIRWTDYYLDVLIITNIRVIDIEQKGLFNRDIASVRLDRIQDIKIETKGLIQTLIRVGDIHIQTAGIDKEFVMRGVKNPENAKKIIMDLHHQKVDEVKTVRIETPEV